jgi:hypothetical protein
MHVETFGIRINRCVQQQLLEKLKIEWFLGQFQKLGEIGVGIFEDFCIG